MSRAERVAELAVGTPVSAVGAAVRPVVLAGERSLPLLPALEHLFPAGGLRRGSTVVVSAGPPAAGPPAAGPAAAGPPAAGPAAAPPAGPPQGATSLALAIGAAASAAGSWCAAVGLPDLGLVAAAELGLVLERLALVPDVAPDRWVTVMGALIDAVDVVVGRPPAHLRIGDARRLTTRARERGTVLVPVVTGLRGVWADGADVRLMVTGGRWEGPGAGDGHLVTRHLEIATGGRGAAARPRQVGIWLPTPGGGIALTPDALTPDAVTRDAVTRDASAPAPADGTPLAYAGADAHLIPDIAEPPGRPGDLRTAG